MTGTYTIQTRDPDHLEALNDEKSRVFGNRVFSGFELIETGSYAGGYRGVVDEEDVIFLPDEIANVMLEHAPTQAAPGTKIS